MDQKDANLLNLAKDLMTETSGYSLWRVTGTWAYEGRTGEIDHIVKAITATEAIARAWEAEDDGELRTISAAWLCPVECVLQQTEHPQ